MRGSPLFLLLTCLLASCFNRGEEPLTSSDRLLNTDSLPAQRITVINDRDTVLRLQFGGRIRIEKGSFSRDTVQLDIKEAYTIGQIVQAGLTTRSDQGVLSSGGMIYIGRIESDVEIRKPISVSIPTKMYDPGMKRYIGKNADGRILWTEPAPLDVDSSAFLALGEKLFQESCASCHSFDKILTGPKLTGFRNRGYWNRKVEVLKWISNPAVYIPTNCYTGAIQQQFGSVMPGFPSLSSEEQESLYQYLLAEDQKRAVFDSVKARCQDSCFVYDSLVRSLDGRVRSALIAGNQNPVEREQNGSAMPLNRSNRDQSDAPKYVERVDYQPVYYVFEIQSFDWFNVDKLLGQTDESSELEVKLTGAYRDSMNLFIVVPEYRIFDRGGLLKGKDYRYGFYHEDGGIPLPKGINCLVFTLGEKRGEVCFAIKAFRAEAKNTLELEPQPVSRDSFSRLIATYQWDELDIRIQKSKNAAEIRKMDEALKSKSILLESFRPRHCDCDCSDTSHAIQSPLRYSF